MPRVVATKRLLLLPDIKLIAYHYTMEKLNKYIKSVTQAILRMTMTSENIKNYTEAAKNVILAFAVIIGGIWTLYVFDAKLEVDNSEAQLTKMKRELVTKPVIIADINTFPLKIGNMWLTKIVITLTNKGNMDTYLEFDNNVLRVAHLQFDKDGAVSSFERIIFSDIKRLPAERESLSFYQAKKLFLFAGHTKSVEFVVNLNKSGAYQIDFSANPGKEIVNARKDVVKDKKYGVVSVSTIVIIR